LRKTVVAGILSTDRRQ